MLQKKNSLASEITCKDDFETENNVFANRIVFVLVKLDKSAEDSEAVGAGEETGHKFHFASTAVQSCSTQDYELLILSVSVIHVLLFRGNIANVVLPCYRLVCHGLLRNPYNQGTKSPQTTFGP